MVTSKKIPVNAYAETGRVRIVDINKSVDGTETNVVGENNMVRLDCLKAKALLKLKMRQKDQQEGR